jgi:hypothetical protein
MFFEEKNKSSRYDLKNKNIAEHHQKDPNKNKPYFIYSW